jgi:hypothetical protein
MPKTEDEGQNSSFRRSDGHRSSILQRKRNEENNESAFFKRMAKYGWDGLDKAVGHWMPESSEYHSGDKAKCTRCAERSKNAGGSPEKKQLEEKKSIESHGLSDPKKVGADEVHNAIQSDVPLSKTEKQEALILDVDKKAPDAREDLVDHKNMLKGVLSKKEASKLAKLEKKKMKEDAKLKASSKK